MCFNNVDTEFSFEGGESEAGLKCTEASLASLSQKTISKMIPTRTSRQSLACHL